MPIAILTLTLHLPGVSSLKAKRSIIKPMLARLHREFNVSVSEIDLNDHWQHAKLQIVMVGNDAAILDAVFQEILRFFEGHWPDVYLADEKFEII